MKILTENYYTVFHASAIFQVIVGKIMMFYHYPKNYLKNCTSMKQGVVIFS